MEIKEFIKEVQEIVDKEYPNLGIHFCKYVDPERPDRKSSEIISSVCIGVSISFALMEWELNNLEKHKEILIKMRILDALHNVQDLAKESIERIENAKT